MARDSLYRDRNLQVIFGVTLMAILGVSSITPAFPSIMRELNLTGSQIGLLITFFTLPGVILAPVMGVLADRFGRKRILVPSLFFFAIAGTACTFASDFNALLGMRVVQGIGAASLGGFLPVHWRCYSPARLELSFPSINNSPAYRDSGTHHT